MSNLKVILMRGLPASGKTTWAKELLVKEPGKWKRINKDELRLMLDGGKWSKANEQVILHARNNLMTNFLLNGFNVIIDDTNLHSKHEQAIRNEVELLNGIHKYKGTNAFVVEIKDFTDVSLDECISRDQKRANYVGEKVIRGMYNQFLKPKSTIYNPDPNLPMAILVDIDGTLALFGDKNPYNRDYINDEVNDPVRKVVNIFHKVGYKVILVSGRTSKALEETKEWLKENVVLYDEIYMPRPEKDVRKDTIIKQEIWDAYIKDKYFVQFILDDRSSVVQFWRSLGLTVFQVADGEF